MKYYVLFFACFLGSSFLNANNTFKCEGMGFELKFSAISLTGKPILSLLKNGKAVSFYSVQKEYTLYGINVSGESHDSPAIYLTLPTDQESFELEMSVGCTYATMQCTAYRVLSYGY